MNDKDPQLNGHENMLKAGDLLKARRVELGKTIEEAADETKIQKRYLLKIESNEYEVFESEVFLRGFLKSYSSYLGLKPDMMLAIYRRDVKRKEEEKKISLFSTSQRSLPSPRLIVQLILALFVLLVGSYFIYQLYNFQKVPELQILSPENNSVTSEESIQVNGKTDTKTAVMINDIGVETDDDGNFTQEIPLVEGVNTIRVKAIKENNQSKESIAILTITREKVEAPVEIEQESIVQLDKFILEIVDSEAWIQLIVDGKQELGHVVAAGYRNEYQVIESFEVTTGKVTSTRLLINGENESVQFVVEDGIGRISCRLENYRLNCDN